MAKRNDTDWQYAAIVIPAGVGITRSFDGRIKRRSSNLVCHKARRRVVNGQPVTHRWYFDWLGIEHYVRQEEVEILT